MNLFLSSLVPYYGWPFWLVIVKKPLQYHNEPVTFSSLPAIINIKLVFFLLRHLIRRRRKEKKLK